MLIHRHQVVRGDELDTAAAALAERLVALGAADRHRVALLLGNTPGFFVALLAVFRLGASAVLLNPQLRGSEIAETLERTGAGWLVAPEERPPAWGRLAEKVCSGGRFDSGASGPLGLWRSGAKPCRAPEGELTLQLTSGVTGRSKIVPRTVTNLADELEHFAALLALGPGDTVLCPSPLFHAYGLVNGCLLPLFTGARAILVDWFLPADVLDAARRHHATVLVGVPAMYRSLAASHGGRARDLASLRIRFSAGAPLSPAILGAFEQRFAQTIHQQYGSTETGVIAVNLGPGDEGRDPLAVGRAVPGRTIAVVDGDGVEVTAGAEGEVVVRSAGSAVAYLDDPEQSARHFRDRAYWTGDLGRIDPAGDLVLTGRRTALINCAGFKVDPREVENVLSELEVVAECAVFGAPDPVAGELVKAAIVTRGTTTEQEVRCHCIRRLARFKVPRELRFVEALPRTATGKVLTKYLVDR